MWEKSARQNSLLDRLQAYPNAMRLRSNLGWGYKRIARFLNLPRSTVHGWIRGRHSPSTCCNVPNLGPSAQLSYAAGAFLGDGGLIRASGYQYELRFRVRDAEFAEKFAACLSFILNKHIETRRDEKGFFIVRAWSRLLFEYLSRRISIEETAELYTAEFVRGFADAEGCPAISSGRSRQLGLYIAIVNTDRQLLEYIATLLRVKFEIRSRMQLERRRHRMWSKLPCYYLIIGRRADQKRFADAIGFSIERKRERLVIALSLLDEFGPRRGAVEWEKLFEKDGRNWARRRASLNTGFGAPGGTFSG